VLDWICEKKPWAYFKGMVNMRIVCLSENTRGMADCPAEHGLSFYIETERHKVLMDTGQSDLFIRNAEKLGIDLKDVDSVFLSHGHYDHGGGLPAFAGIGGNARIYIRKEAFGDFYSGSGGKVHYIGLSPGVRSLPGLVITGKKEETGKEEGIYRIDGELSLFSGIGNKRPLPSANDTLMIMTKSGLVRDDFSHEQCLVVTEGERQVLLSGCAHHGILNVLDRFREIYRKEPYAVVSGFHMSRKDGICRAEDIRMIRDTALELIKTETVFYTGHCTGTGPFDIMKKIMGDRLRYVHCGDQILF
jgi:metal-dependent hydrolase (beta-lactamase superfamily II)